jgi:hypothetical protein
MHMHMEWFNYFGRKDKKLMTRKVDKSKVTKSSDSDSLFIFYNSYQHTCQLSN